MLCLTAWGQWAVQLLQNTTYMPGGTGSRSLLTSGTPLMHCLTAAGQWAVELLPCTASAVELLPCTASLPWGSGQCNSCDTLPHLPRRWSLSKEHNSSNALPHCLGAVGNGNPVMQCLIAWGRWAVELLSCITTLTRGSGQCNSCNTLPHCPGAVGSGTSARHCRIAWGQWAVAFLQCTPTPPGGAGQWKTCNAPPHCQETVASGTPAMRGSTS